MSMATASRIDRVSSGIATYKTSVGAMSPSDSFANTLAHAIPANSNAVASDDHANTF